MPKIRHLSVIMLWTVSGGCENPGETQVTTVQATITSVRITDEVSVKGYDSSAVSGAFVGSMIAGPIGAAIGAKGGEPSPQTLSVQGKIVAAGFRAELVYAGKKEVLFFAVSHFSKIEAAGKISLLRPGDNVFITCTKVGENIQYSWLFETRDDSHSAGWMQKQHRAEWSVLGE